jgi:formate hydrogenlyase subunit 3/multisubunit Na+/H+ antiporter MnhD subunit
MENLVFLIVSLPFVAALVLFLIPKKLKMIGTIVFVATNIVSLIIAIFLFGKEGYITIELGKFLPFLSFRLYSLSSFLLLAVWGFCAAVGIFAAVSLYGKDNAKIFNIFFLISGGMASGVLLANDLILLLFFWEGLLIAMFVIITIGKPLAWKTAIKGFIIVGVSDLCMMAGIGLTGLLSGTFTMSAISLDANGLGMLAFFLLMTGAIAKAGSMPFHTWIPDAAIDAPLPFMSILPASLEKILGIYFLARISLDLFAISPESPTSYVLMIFGVVTILFAVMMALVQKNYKRLLAYHAISQVGYMMLGIGTCLPIGILGGLFHMINHAIYKSGLFLTAGSVERQTGTTELKDLGGLARKMPFTFIFFAICAASISGVFPFNGFFSKEFVYGAAFERGLIFYIIAVAGSFFTAASFLKLGHSAFFGKLKDSLSSVREAPILMLIPMGVIAGFCVLFGVWNELPIKSVFYPVLSRFIDEAGIIPHGNAPQTLLIVISVIVLGLAILNHFFGVFRTKSGVGALDHISHAPVMKSIYAGAEKRYFDPYEWGRYVMRFVARFLSLIDKGFDYVVTGLTAKFVEVSGSVLRVVHSGNHRSVLAWAFIGILTIAVFIMIGVV